MADGHDGIYGHCGATQPVKDASFSALDSLFGGSPCEGMKVALCDGGTDMGAF